MPCAACAAVMAAVGLAARSLGRFDAGCRTTDQTRARMCLQDRLNVAQEEYRSQRVTLLDLFVVLDDNREHRHPDLLQESHFH